MNIKNKKHNYKILSIDPYLTPYESDIELRMSNYANLKNKLLGNVGRGDPDAPFDEGRGGASGLAAICR